MQNQNTTSPEPKAPVMTGSPVETPIVLPVIESKAPAGERLIEKPLYKTIVGELKTHEEVNTYIKNLEEMVVQAKAAPTAPPQQTVLPQAVKAEPTAKERFAELIFSNPDQAFDVVRQDVFNEIDKRTNAEKQRDNFWNDFYSKNEHLKNSKHLIDYIVRANKGQIDQMADSKTVSDFLIKEASNIIDPIKKQYSGVETKLESDGVVNLGASGESFNAPQNNTPTGPQSLTAQLMSLNSRRRKK